MVRVKKEEERPTKVKICLEIENTCCLASADDIYLDVLMKISFKDRILEATC